MKALSAIACFCICSCEVGIGPQGGWYLKPDVETTDRLLDAFIKEGGSKGGLSEWVDDAGDPIPDSELHLYDLSP